MSENSTVETHESYGMAVFSRFAGGPSNFFGSATKHHAGVSLEIHRGSVKRDLGESWYMEAEPLIRIEMSESQFAQLITSMNRSAVPVTLTRVFRSNVAKFKNDSIEKCPEVCDRAQIQNDFKKVIEKMTCDLDDLIAQAKALQAKPHIGKADREKFVKIAEEFKVRITNNFPFYQQQFSESISNIEQDARANFESFVQQTLRSVGLEALKSKLAETGIVLQLDTGSAPTNPPNEP